MGVLPGEELLQCLLDWLQRGDGCPTRSCRGGPLEGLAMKAARAVSSRVRASNQGVWFAPSPWSLPMEYSGSLRVCGSGLLIFHTAPLVIAKTPAARAI